MDKKSFPYRSLLGRILRDPFLIGIPLGITKHGEQDISLYTQSWVASNPLSRSSAYLTPSTLTPSTSWWRQGRQLCLLPRRGRQLRLLPRRGRQLRLLLRQGRQLRLLLRRGRQLRLLPR